MTAEALTEKYITAMEKTIKDMQPTKGPITITQQCINELFGYITAYLEDAKYFRNQKKYETSLTSIAYCEGLLDALKLIGATKTPTTP
jgi:hypothetical protein